MKSLEQVDKNFIVKTQIDKQDICFYDIKENKQFLFGLLWDDIYRRMPEKIAKKTSEGVHILHTNTSGGRIRFITDSPYVALSVKMPVINNASQMPRTGKSGFDLYVNNRFSAIFIPPITATNGYEGVAELGERKEREITIHFPPYTDVSDVYVGIAQGSILKEATPYKYEKKVVFYGSSITQGGCVTRPGNIYTSHLSRKLSFDYINLGFSGSAKGEEIMAEYIATLDPLVFVLDYDHNSPSVEHLQNTHERFFKIFRNIRKETPVIMISAPDIRFRNNDVNFPNKEWIQRRDIIENTYKNALKENDENVFFIDGDTLWEEDWDSCTMDTTHPNDMGHFLMAKNIAPVLKKALEK